MSKDLDRSFLFSYTTERLATARAAYDAASYRLELDTIRNRAAEVGSQAFAFVARGALVKELGEITDREREIALRLIRYAVYGRTDNE